MNNPDTTAHGDQLSMCSGTHQVVMSDGTQAVADTTHLSSSCSIYDLYTNRLGGSPTVVPRHSGPTGFTAPIVAPANLPQLPAFIVNVATGCGIATVAANEPEPAATGGPAPGPEPVTATPADHHQLHTAC